MKNTIIQGDCRSIFPALPRETYTHIITDPPYNINFKGYDEYSDNLSPQEYIDMVALFCGIPSCFVSYAEESMTYLLPALGIPKKVMAWCYNSNLPRQFRLLNYFNCTPDLSQIKQPYKNPTDKRIKRLIQGGSAGTALYDWFSDIQIVKNVSKEKTRHPCPVPEELIIRVILLLTKEGDTILDPFMGSGTTAVACLRTNRNYIGIEKSQKYIDIANERLYDFLGKALA